MYKSYFGILVVLCVVISAVQFAACGSSDEGCGKGYVNLGGTCEPDRDNDTIPDRFDNCPDLYNPSQRDMNLNGIGDKCEDFTDGDADPDTDSSTDGDVVSDSDPDLDGDLPQEIEVADEADADDVVEIPDGDIDDTADIVVELDDDLVVESDPEPDVIDTDDGPALGTVENPIIIPGDPMAPDYLDQRDTSQGPSDRFDAYPPNELDESGPEFVYQLTLDVPVNIHAFIAYPEPDGVDVDVHLLSSVEPLTLIARGHYEVSAVLQPGVYWLILDTFVDSGTPMPGPYNLTVSMARYAAGTMADPIVINEVLDPPLPLPYIYKDDRDTTTATSDVFDAYPPNELDESGPEFIYTFALGEQARVSANILVPEPDGTDIDLHLLSGLSPLGLIDRDNTSIYAVLDPGQYFISMDTYVSGGVDQTGPYGLRVTFRSTATGSGTYFNSYILAAIDYLYANYGILGYADVALTHDIPYGSYGLISAHAPPRTMCVAAVMEVILTAMIIYADETGDDTVYEYLPKSSWERLDANSIRGHIWVNHSYPSYGTADALSTFGMGENVPFEQLQPGGVINLNRTTGSGHAVVFLAYIDEEGNDYTTYDDNVIGFKYFSSQGGYNAGSGGLDYRYAIFSTTEYVNNGYPEMPYNRDINVIRSTSQVYLNTGMMFHPDHWMMPSRRGPVTNCGVTKSCEPSVFDPVYFDGKTVDDIL